MSCLVAARQTEPLGPNLDDANKDLRILDVNVLF